MICARVVTERRNIDEKKFGAEGGIVLKQNPFSSTNSSRAAFLVVNLP
jgi:hypothetical protein